MPQEITSIGDKSTFTFMPAELSPHGKRLSVFFCFSLLINDRGQVEKHAFHFFVVVICGYKHRTF